MEEEGGLYISVEDGLVKVEVVVQEGGDEWGKHTITMDPVMALQLSDSILIAAGYAAEERKKMESGSPDLTVIKGGKPDGTIH